MNYYYDEEAVIQDADIEMAHAIARGNYLARLERNGICTHSSTVGVSSTGEIFYPEQIGLVGEQERCRDCGLVFEDEEEWRYVVTNL
jgi:hypothetical protein